MPTLPVCGLRKWRCSVDGNIQFTDAWNERPTA